MSLQPIATKRLQVDNATTRTISDFGFTSEELAKAKYATITARDSAAVFACVSGEVPASTFGHLIGVDGTAKVADQDAIAALVFLSDTSTKAAITITLEG